MVINIRNSSLIIGTALVLIFLLAGCNASETPILTAAKSNLSLNLSSNYNISSGLIPSTGNGLSMQDIVINNMENQNESANIEILSFFLMEIFESDNNEIQEFMDNMFFGIFKLSGAHETETYNLSNHYNQNVTIHAIDIPDAKNPKSSNLTYITSMKLDQLNYIYIFSSNKSLMKNIVESLAIVE